MKKGYTDGSTNKKLIIIIHGTAQRNFGDTAFGGNSLFLQQTTTGKQRCSQGFEVFVACIPTVCRINPVGIDREACSERKICCRRIIMDIIVLQLVEEFLR